MCTPQPAADHLGEFHQAFNQERGPWVGRAPQKWAQHVTGTLRQGLPLNPQDRYALREWLPQKPLDDQLLAICAWGGMRVGNGRTMWDARDSALGQDNLTKTLRGLPKLNRREAYTRFRDLRSGRMIPGVGPAYFTKLIHFMGPGDGYILDQWTARSINLLFGPIIHLNPLRVNQDTRSWWVADRNSTHHYERYCRCIERLAAMLTADPSEVEYALFAPGPWRDYLRAHPPTNDPVAPFCEEDWPG